MADPLFKVQNVPAQKAAANFSRNDVKKIKHRIHYLFFSSPLIAIAARQKS